ncbi:MAG: AsmA-like C-terminal region-containing protein [Candidatus Riflebacteria bacterium]|nr:AsmA-like C-terminal region-containing protein [Candidatus Riflebacteria bacterium]
MTQTNENVNETTNDMPDKPKKGFFYYIKIAIVATSIAALVAAGAAFYVFHKLTTDGNLEKLINKELTKATGMQVSFEKIAISFPTINLINTKIATDTPEITLISHTETISVRPDFFAAIKGKFFIDKLEIASSTNDFTKKTSLSKKDEPKDNKSEPQSQNKKIDLTQVEIPFKSIEISDINVFYKDVPKAQNYSIKLNKAQISSSMLSKEIPIYLDAEVKDIAALRLNGNIEWPDTLAANANIQVIKLDKIKEAIPNEYAAKIDINKLSDLTSQAFVNYNFAQNTLKLNDVKISAKPNILITANADFSSLSPVLGKIDAQLKSTDAMFLTQFAAPFVPQEYQFEILNGKLAASVEAEFKPNSIIAYLANIIPDKVHFKTPMFPQKIQIQKAPISFDGNKINVVGAEILTADQKINIPNFSFSIKDSTFKANADSSLQLEKTWKDIALPLMAQIQPKNEEVKSIDIAGLAALNIEASGKISDPQIKGTVNLNKTNLKHKILPEKLTDISGLLKFSLKQIETDKLVANFGKTSASVSGNVSLGEKIAFDTSLDIAANIGETLTTLKPILPESVKAIDAIGNSDIKIKISGTTDNPVLNGVATLKDATFKHPATLRPIEKINGPIEFTLSDITCKNLSAYWGTSKATVNGKITDFSKFMTNFAFTVEPLDVTDAAGFFLTGSGYEVRGNGKGTGTITGPLEKIKVNCEAQAFEGTANATLTENKSIFKFPYKNLKAVCVYQNDVFTVSTASMEIFGGNIYAKGNAYIASDPISFDFQTNIDMIKTEEFLTQNLDKKYANMIAGGLKGAFSARGNTLGLSSLTGTANISMPKGTYNSPPIISQIANKFKEAKFASGVIENVSGNYRLENGRIISDNALANISEGNISFSGSIGLDATINGTSKINLKREVSLKDPTLKQLIGDNKQLEIPIKIKGTLMSPELDMPIDKMLKQALEEKSKALINKELQKLTNKLGLPGVSSKTPAKPADAKAAEVKATESKSEDLNKKIDAEKKKLEEKLKKGLNKLFKK